METLGRYEILNEIGRGGCGIVYRAIDPSIGRTVAIKTIRADASDDSLRERFRREARSAGMLSHPNIVTIHEFNDSGNLMFIAMEFVEGQTLAQRMQGQKLPIHFVLTTLRSAADALDYAHSHNIVHRDVKPANFLITDSGRLKITDFGIAKMLDSDVGLTNTGMVIGTAQYMSPEQITAVEVTGRSDEFSLGVVAYEMLAGRRPFEGNSWASMMHNIMASDPPPISQFREELGAPVTEVLRKVLAKDPQDRYGSCMAFVDALEGAILGNSAERASYWAMMGTTSSVARTGETAPIPARQAAVPVDQATRTIAMSQRPVAITETKSGAIPQPALTAAPLATHEAQQPGPPKRSWLMPTVAAVAVLVGGLGAWLALREKPHAPAVTQAPVVTAAVPQPEASAPATPAIEPDAAPAPPPVTPAPESRVASPKQPASPNAPKRQSAAAPTPVVVTPPVPAPAAVATNSPAPVVAASPAPAPPAPTPPPPAQPTPVQQTPVQQAVVPPTPAQQAPIQPPVTPPAARVVEPPPQTPTAATPTPAAPKAPDPAEIAAKQRAAELQASRRMIAEAVSRYRQAFENKNMDALKAVWPRLGRNDQTSFQNFFRIARSIKLELTLLGDPELTASGATARFRRTMTATDTRGALPAENQVVKITFRKSGDQMLIDSIEATDR